MPRPRPTGAARLQRDPGARHELHDWSNAGCAAAAAAAVLCSVRAAAAARDAVRARSIFRRTADSRGPRLSQRKKVHTVQIFIIIFRRRESHVLLHGGRRGRLFGFGFFPLFF